MTYWCEKHSMINYTGYFVCENCGFCESDEPLVTQPDFNVPLGPVRKHVTYQGQEYIHKKAIILAGLVEKEVRESCFPLTPHAVVAIHENIRKENSWRKVKSKLNNIYFSESINHIPSIYGHPVHVDDYSFYLAHTLMHNHEIHLKYEFIIAKMKFLQTGDHDSYKWIPLHWTPLTFKKHEEIWKEILETLPKTREFKPLIELLKIRKDEPIQYHKLDFKKCPNYKALEELCLIVHKHKNSSTSDQTLDSNNKTLNVSPMNIKAWKESIKSTTTYLAQCR